MGFRSKGIVGACGVFGVNLIRCGVVIMMQETSLSRDKPHHVADAGTKQLEGIESLAQWLEHSQELPEENTRVRADNATFEHWRTSVKPVLTPPKNTPTNTQN